MNIAELILWIAAALLVYTYFGYPALIRLWSALPRRTPRHADDGELPLITVVIVAHNEAEGIRERLENIFGLDYPEDRLRVLLASDGSTDATVSEARALHSARLTLVEFSKRRGKAAVLNDVVPATHGDIVMFGDARQRFDRGVPRALVKAFKDPKVGAVSGELLLDPETGDSEVGEGMSFYWRYETFIRHHESRVDSTVGVTGAIYAIRQHLFRPIPDTLILDDVLIPMQIVRQGYRVRFEPRARAHDRASSDARGEFERKLRTIAGNFQLFFLKPWLLNPFINRLWLQTVSHKGTRLLSPLWLGVVLGTSCYLVTVPIYRYVLLAQILIYALAAAGYAARRRQRHFFLLNVPYTFCLLNVATVVAFFSFLLGRQKVTWNKTAGATGKASRAQSLPKTAIGNPCLRTRKRRS